MKTKILYLCANDGSDTRVVKEINTYNKKHDVYYLGVGNDATKSHFSSEICLFNLVAGSHKSIITITKTLYSLSRLLIKYKFEKVHVVDEQFYIFFAPLLVNQHVILDVFDSYFLKLNKPYNNFFLLKRIVYALPKSIIVTDEQRLSLMPNFVTHKVTVIPNVPNFVDYSNLIKSNSNMLRICYFGTLSKDRGSSFLKSLVEEDDRVSVVAAGWVSDDFTKDMIKHDRVSYIGVKKQEEVNRILTVEGDYLLAIYPVNNINNIYASPNKIYDSFQTFTPLIINEEVLVSSFVRDQNIGFVVNKETSNIVDELIKNKNKYSFNKQLVLEHCWEKFESKLYSL